MPLSQCVYVSSKTQRYLTSIFFLRRENMARVHVYMNTFQLLAIVESPANTVGGNNLISFIVCCNIHIQELFILNVILNVIYHHYALIRKNLPLMCGDRIIAVQHTRYHCCFLRRQGISTHDIDCVVCRIRKSLSYLMADVNYLCLFRNDKNGKK